MSKDDDGLGSPRDEGMDAGLQTPDKLDLNVDQDCHSLNVVEVSGTQHSPSPIKDGSFIDGVLKIGTEFESDEHAYKFYNTYARLVGFSVRKDWVNRSKIHGLVVSRKYTCSKEGYRRKDKRDVNVKKHRKETRTGCLAHMIVTRQPDGKYRVTHFEAEHNHDNINPYNPQTLPLQEEVCVAQAVEANSSCNLGAQSNTDSELMNRKFEVGESLDHLAMDFDNYLCSERIRDMKRGEAGRLLRYFQRQHFENPSFFHAIQVDMDDKISNIFWADDKMVVDYCYFGDVICLDTSYLRNKDLQPFVLFIGVNHHNQPIVFAAALLFEDTIESFKWLFSTFAEVMSCKRPKVILTEQDATVVEAINSVLPEISHHFCVWQMYQNTLKHLSHALKDNESFSSDFRSCIYEHTDEEDFIHSWETLLDKHGLEENEWLKWMFREKEKWALIFGWNSFFLDAKGFYVAEDLHNNLRNCLDSDQDILQFFKAFDRMVNEQRLKELYANNEMTECTPRLMGNIVMLKHASEIYTPRAFEIFQREYEKCLNFVVSQCSENGLLIEYKVNTFGRSRKYTVKFNLSDETVFCSCMKLENVGFLCGHALKVLDYRNIKVVPSQYMLKRWTKDARIGRLRGSGEFITQENPKLVAASRYKDLCHRMLTVSARAAESEEAFQFASQQLDEVIEGVEKILALKPEAQVMTSSSTPVNGSETENVDIFGDERTAQGQDVDRRMAGIKEQSIVPGRQQPKRMKERSFKQKGFSSAPYTVTFVSGSSVACVSTEASMSNPLLQGLYNFEAHQEIQCVYQQQNPVMIHQDNPNLYQHSHFYTDQNDSPRQIPLVQAMDLDAQHPQPSSFLLFDNKFKTSDTSYLESS